MAREASTPSASAPAPSASIVIDDFEGKLDWLAQPADGVDLSLRSDSGREGRAMRMDFSFSGGGYAIARKNVALDLPENYELSFSMRGKSLPNTIEFKLVDETGENVWWHVRRDIAIPTDWEKMRSKKRHIAFAWGPKGGGEIAHVSAIEIVVTAAQGGKGSVWIDDLVLRPLPRPAKGPITARASASSARTGQDAQHVLDQSARTRWSPRGDDVHPWIELDLRETRELGGLVLQWAPGKHASTYRVEVKEDGDEWRTVREVAGGNGGRDPLALPETDARFVRIALMPAAGGIALESIELGPLEWATSRETFFAAEAKKARRGIFPRSIRGEQMYWTVVGPDADPKECLLSEDGMLEIGKGKASIEPFLYDNGRLITWADVRVTQELEDGALPIPSVEWEGELLRLRVTAFDAGAAGASSVVARYRVENRSGRARNVTLFLAVRPFQVNPPSQTLNLRGGLAPIRKIDFDGRDMELNGERAVICILPPDDFGASTFDGGEIAGDHLAMGQLPATMACEDATEAGSAALSRELSLAPNGTREYAIAIPLERKSSIPEFASEAEALVWVEKRFQESRDAWRERTWSIAFDLPEPAAAWARAMQSQIGFILVNRAGPAIQPGSRSYARSWIRDGALTSTALLRTGHADAAREFLEWYAPHQYEDGKIPCVVDSRGADPVPEHDSSGEFIYLVAEAYRFDGDRKLAGKMWERVKDAAQYLDMLRQQRRTPEFSTRDKREFYGILPPSISHEGYSAKPMHSYWDDFFALRGFRDAAFLAKEVGKEKDQARLQAIANEFERDLGASIAAAMERHRIDYVPGCADLGDFDATSTTIALSPCGAAHVPPPGAIERTFDGYLKYFRERRDGKAKWEAYTPYEFRTVGSLVRLGRRDDALAAMEYFFNDRRPRGWNQWPEVVWKDARSPRFLGDLPHTWVGSDFMRSFLDLFAFEAGDALVVAAGIPRQWLDRKRGIAVRGLRTQWGMLDLSMSRKGKNLTITIDGTMRVPPSGIVLKPPGSTSRSFVTVNDRSVKPNADGGIVVAQFPATLHITN